MADPEGDSEESARRLREHLENRAGKSLLVFDNAVGPDILRPFLPAGGGTQIVVTSTNEAFFGMGTPVQVGVFTRPESTGYLAGVQAWTMTPARTPSPRRLGTCRWPIPSR